VHSPCAFASELTYERLLRYLPLVNQTKEGLMAAIEKQFYEIAYRVKWADYEIWQDWKAGKAVTWKPGSACGYPPSEVVVVVTDEFSQDYPDAYRFLQNWRIPVEDLTYLCVQTELHKHRWLM